MCCSLFRVLKYSSKLTYENYEKFLRSYELYYNDHIPFRNQLIRFNNSIDYFLFGQSSHEYVAVGKDGWLFYCNNEDGNPIKQSLGYWHFTDLELQTIADNLITTKDSLEKHGIEFVLFIAPNKETIYLEQLPNYYNRKDCSTSTDQLINYLRKNTDIRIVYPKEELLEQKENIPEWPLYYKLDTHWNSLGAYIGATSLVKELGIEMPILKEILIEEKLLSDGDLTKMLNISINDGDSYTLSKFSESSTKCDKNDFYTEYIYHTPGVDQRKLFVRRDSFSTAMAPIVATQFENSVWIHKDAFNQQQLFDSSTDVFILEIVERVESSLKDFKISLLP